MNITKYIFILFILINTSQAIAQNSSYDLLYEGIYPALETDYPTAKSLLLNNMEDIDPSELVLVLDNILEEDDIETFKTISTYLILERGWSFSIIDTNDTNFKLPILLEQIKTHDLVPWLIETSENNYPIWVKSHQKDLFILSEINTIVYASYEIRSYLRKFDKENTDSIISEMDIKHMYRLWELCILNDSMLPNNFDNGIGSYYKITNILGPNLFNKENFYPAWEIIFPFIDKAYLDGKISSNIFYSYDIWCNNHFGYQYYGTLEDVKVTDDEGLLERRMRYSL